MMMTARTWVTCITLSMLTWGLLGQLPGGTAAGPQAVLIPESDYPKVIDHEIKVLQAALKSLKEATDKEQIKKLTAKVRCTAVLLAAVAQDNLAGKDAPERATLRDAAVQVAGLVKSDKVDEAIKQAEGLKGLKADPKAKAEKVKLFDVHIDLTDLMSQFQLPKAGGQGTEKLFLNLALDKKKTIPATGLSDALLVAAYQTAVTGELAAAYDAKKDQKEWLKLSNDMRQAARELAAKVKAKDGKAAFAALNKVNTSCSVCHEKFK